MRIWFVTEKYYAIATTDFHSVATMGKKNSLINIFHKKKKKHFFVEKYIISYFNANQLR